RGDGRGGRRGLGRDRCRLPVRGGCHRAGARPRPVSRAARGAPGRARVGVIAGAIAPDRGPSAHGPGEGGSRLSERLREHWALKLLSLVFAVVLWAFVVSTDRGEAVFTVPIDLTDMPPGLEVTSLGVETVVVRVGGRKSLLERMREEDFRAEVSLHDAKP